jgi:anti-anti-sigma regulatory factor
MVPHPRRRPHSISPQAVTAELAAKFIKLIAALRSRSWMTPHSTHDHSRSESRIHAAIAQSPTKVRRVVVAAEPVTSVDVTAADALAELDDMLREDGIELAFAELKDPVKDKLRRFGLYERFDERGFFLTIESAVDAYCQTHGIEPPP